MEKSLINEQKHGDKLNLKLMPDTLNIAVLLGIVNVFIGAVTALSV